MIDILVPILGRAPNAMLRSLEYATTEPFQVYFICSPDDDEQFQTCLQTGRPTWIVDWDPGPADFAKKINYGYTHTDGEWIFQGADDIRFSPGWDTEALAIAGQTGAQVIGTNDLHNPAVKRKAHATHILFARAYIEGQGGTLDGTGAVFSEIYDHNFVDNEFIEIAKMRGTWAFAEKAIVEHLHPVWGLADWDPTYRKAYGAFDADHKLYFQRMREAQRMQRAVRR